MARHLTTLWISLLLLAALAGGAGYLLQRPDPLPLVAYSQEPLRRGPISALVSATGTLYPVQTVQVGSQVSGTIQALYADFNDRVEKAQVIAQINPAIFKARLAEAHANLKSAEASRDKSRISMLDAKRLYERQADLYKKRLVAESVRDAARFTYQAAQVEYQIQTASVSQAVAATDREQLNLDYTTIYAPIDGVIISRDVDVGQTVAASLQAPTLFSIANDLTRMQVEADVDEAFIGEVRPGQPVTFSVFAYPRRQFQGRVAQVRLQPKVEAGVVKYNCIIRVDNGDLALKPGMTATVAIEVARREGVLTVSNTALRFVPPWPAEALERLRRGLQPGQSILWRVEGEGLTPLTVTTGIIGEKLTEVSGEGVTEAMPIAVPLKRKENGPKRRFGLSLF